MSNAQLGSALKGQFLQGSTKQRHEDQEHYDPLTPHTSRQVFLKEIHYCGSLLPTRTHFLFKNITKVLHTSLSIALPILKNILVLQNHLQPLQTNLSARKDKQIDNEVF